MIKRLWKWKNRTQKHVLTHQTIVLWDFENIHYNNVRKITKFVKWLKKMLSGSNYIFAIGQLSILKDSVKNRLTQLNVKLIDATSKKKNFSDIILINEAYQLVTLFDSNCRFCFVTKDGDYAKTMSQLIDWGYEVWLITCMKEYNSVLREIVDKIILIPQSTIT